MGQSLALAQGQGLGGRLEGARQGVVVDGLAARPRGRQRQREVADGDALKVPELAVLQRVSSMKLHLGEHQTDVWEQPWPLARWQRARTGDLRLVDHLMHLVRWLWRRIRRGCRSGGGVVLFAHSSDSSQAHWDSAGTAAWSHTARSG